MTDINLEATPHDRIVEARRRAILNFCEIPQTLEDIAKHTGYGYHTIRADVNSMVSQFLMRPTGRVRRRAALYKSGAQGAIPFLYNIKTDNEYAITDILTNWLNNSQPRSQASLAADNLMPLMVEWLSLLAEVTKPDGSSVSQSELYALKDKFAEELKAVEVVVNFYKQMIGGTHWELSDLIEKTTRIPVNHEDLIQLVAKYNDSTHNNIPDS